MQEVREAPKYRVVLTTDDVDLSDVIAASSFRADKPLTREYIQNLKKSLSAVLDIELKKYCEEIANEKVQ